MNFASDTLALVVFGKTVSRMLVREHRLLHGIAVSRLPIFVSSLSGFPNSYPCVRPYVICGEGELVGGVHPLVGGVVQVYHRLQVIEEEEKERKVEQEIGRIRVKRTHR